MQDALDYTDEQVADLLLLKSLVLTKLQEIDQVRTDALITAAQHAKAGTARLDAAHEVTTARLDALSAQTFQTYVEFGLAFRLGVSLAVILDICLALQSGLQCCSHYKVSLSTYVNIKILWSFHCKAAVSQLDAFVFVCLSIVQRRRGIVQLMSNCLLFADTHNQTACCWSCVFVSTAVWLGGH